MKHTETVEWLEYKKLMKERPEEFKQTKYSTIITDEKIVNEYVKKTNKRIGVIYASQYNIFLIDLVYDKENGYYIYERIISSNVGDSVVIMPMYQGKIVLLEQYRQAKMDIDYSFPRGFGEEGITSIENAKKEIKEELGADVIDYKYLGKMIADSGKSGNKVSVFVCEVKSIEIKKNYEGIQDIKILSFEEFEEYIRKGKITDGFTLSVYSLYRAFNLK